MLKKAVIILFVYFPFQLGLDYVGHEDVLPYKTTEKQPVQNHLFDKFLAVDADTGTVYRENISLHIECYITSELLT